MSVGHCLAEVVALVRVAHEGGHLPQVVFLGLVVILMGDGVVMLAGSLGKPPAATANLPDAGDRPCRATCWIRFPASGRFAVAFEPRDMGFSHTSAQPMSRGSS